VQNDLLPGSPQSPFAQPWRNAWRAQGTRGGPDKSATLPFTMIAAGSCTRLASKKKSLGKSSYPICSSCGDFGSSRLTRWFNRLSLHNVGSLGDGFAPVLAGTREEHGIHAA